MLRHSRHNESSGVANALNPVRGYRDSLRRRGIEPKDHARENVRAMREAARANRGRKERDSENQPVDEGFKMKRFQGVDSKFRKVAEEKFSPDGEKKPFLKRSTQAGPPPLPTEPHVSRRPQVKPAVPRVSEAAAPAPKSDRNFLRENAREAIAGASRRSRETTDTDASAGAAHAPGAVPTYLRRRKEEWAREAEAERRERERTDGCPPGMVVMPDHERLETLQALRQSEAEVKATMAKLPLMCETPGQIRRKEALEAKMREIEDALRIFDRPRVLIREDA